MKKFLAATLLVAGVGFLFTGCAGKEEPQTPPTEELQPAPEPVVNQDSIDAENARLDSINAAKAAEEAAAAAKKPATKKKSQVKSVEKSTDGSASGGQIRPSRDDKEEGAASGGQIRKSR